jgi:hypothetical protein
MFWVQWINGSNKSGLSSQEWTNSSWFCKPQILFQFMKGGLAGLWKFTNKSFSWHPPYSHASLASYLVFHVWWERDGREPWHAPGHHRERERAMAACQRAPLRESDASRKCRARWCSTCSGAAIMLRSWGVIIIESCRSLANTSRNQCPPQPSEEWLCVLYNYTMTWEHKLVPVGDV